MVMISKPKKKQETVCGKENISEQVVDRFDFKSYWLLQVVQVFKLGLSKSSLFMQFALQGVVYG